MKQAAEHLRFARPSSTPTLVWVLAPLVETDDPEIAWYSDHSQGHAEYARAFEDLGLEWRWLPVTLREHLAAIERIVAESAALGAQPIVINLCDGDEAQPGSAPGLSVIRALEAAGLPYSGADEHFYHITTSKIDMKAAFARARVPTAPWEVIEPGTNAAKGIFSRLGSPLILKPAISAGSLGITTKSVVHTPQALRAQMQRLAKGYHGWDLAAGGVIAERFVDGPEFTTFIVGDHDDREHAIIYAPVERAFNEKLPPTERFLSFDRLWGMYETEAPLEGDAELWQYRRAPRGVIKRLREVSWAAYAAVGGRGYGRVDLRQDAATGELFVLEVNAQCGISEDEDFTSIGAILRFARTPFSHLVREIIRGAVRPARATPAEDEERAIA